jgi:diguanylate cyclase (GGDEF)-like protein
MNPFEVALQMAALAARFEELAKTAPEIRAAMQHLNQQTKSGAFDPKHADAIRRGLFTDRLTGNVMGNQAAYEDFVESIKDKPSEWTHVRMDGNDFKAINSMHGYKTGDEAITQMGKTIRDAVNDSVGQSHSKLFRLGGDEFHLAIHHPNHREGAAHFVRTARNKLSSLAPLKGTHNWSLSYGIAHTPEHSDEALIQAKKAKAAAGHPVGQAEHYAHSLLPGLEGPIPTQTPTTQFRIA